MAATDLADEYSGDSPTGLQRCAFRRRFVIHLLSVNQAAINRFVLQFLSSLSTIPSVFTT